MNHILHIALQVEYVKYSITKAASLNAWLPERTCYPQTLLLASNLTAHEYVQIENTCKIFIAT